MKTVLFKVFRQAEYLQFFEDVASICQKSDLATLGLQDQVNALQAINVQLDSNFKIERGSSLTESLTQLDTQRDNALRLLLKISRAYALHYDETLQKAADTVKRAIVKYDKHIELQNYQTETAMITNLGNDIQTDTALSDALNALHLQEVASHLVSVNTAFNELFLNRVDEAASVIRVNTGELIRQGKEAYLTLENHLEAHALLNPSPTLSELNQRLDALIDKYNSTMSLRGSRSNETTSSENIDEENIIAS